MRNLRIFHTLDHKIQEVGEDIKIIIEVEEKFTILPIIKAGVIENNFWIQPGFVDYNFLGNKSVIGGNYRYYERHSVEVFYKNPYFFSKQWGLTTDAGYQATIEPTDTFELGTVTRYNADIRKINLLLNYNLSLKQYFQFGVGYLNELYVKRETNKPGPDRMVLNKLIFKLEHHIDHLNYNGALLDGFANSVLLEGVYDAPRRFDFFKVYNQFRQFFQFFKQDTLAYRVQFGVSSNRKTLYPPFVIDSFLNVRGAGDRVKRGYLENSLNVEYRYLFPITSWASIQLVWFSDHALLLSLGDEVNFFVFMGAGARLIFNKVYNAIFVFDYAVNLQDQNDRGYLFKIGQYF